MPNHIEYEVSGHFGGVWPTVCHATPRFGTSVNLISTRGGRLCPLITTGTPGFSDLPTALKKKRLRFVMETRSTSILGNDMLEMRPVSIEMLLYINS